MNNTGWKIYHICLTDEERQNLQWLVDQGKGAVSSRRRAQILFLADTSCPGGGRKDADIVDIIGGGTSTIERKYQENRKPRLLDGEG